MPLVNWAFGYVVIRAFGNFGLVVIWAFIGTFGYLGIWTLRHLAV